MQSKRPLTSRPLSIRSGLYPPLRRLGTAHGAFKVEAFKAEAPSSKLQAPGQLQIPNSTRAAIPLSGARLGQPEAGPITQYFKAVVGVWSLVFPWSLVLGGWSLERDAIFQ